MNLKDFLAQSSSSKHAAVSAQNTNGGFGLWANSPTGTAIYGQGKLAGHFQGDVQVNGKLTVSVDVVLTGADFAEDFQVEASEAVEPGTAG